jgi:ABC-type transporter Mla maintaining outer membrane lipid asymmetry ATPase subunit MlaF
MADRIVFMVDGRAISGTPESLLASDDERVVEFLEAEKDQSTEDFAARTQAFPVGGGAL